jgi:hypothetical protein
MRSVISIFTDFAQQHLGRVDAKTEQVTLYELPTNSVSQTKIFDGSHQYW